jgi:hypothetical protein
VFLKVDDVRVAITVTYEPTQRRIVIEPQAPLNLLVVYTVELSTGIRTAAGGAFPRTWFWQFTTISIRRPTDPFPATGSSEHSPFVLLGWGGMGSIPGTPQFLIYAGPDSAAVAARGVAPLATSAATIWYPRARWPENAVTYWSVRAINLATGEFLDSPVWSFRTLDPLAHTQQTIVLTATMSGWQLESTRNSRSCSQATLTCGPGYFTGIRWDLAALPAGVRIAGVELRLTSTPGTASQLPGGLTAWATLAPIEVCSMFDRPPLVDEAGGQVASVTSVSSPVATLRSDALAAHVEAARRFPGFNGYRIRSSVLLSLVSSSSSESTQRPQLSVTYYNP